MQQRHLALLIASIGFSISVPSFAQSIQSAFQVGNTQSIADSLKNYKSLAPLVTSNNPNQQNNSGATPNKDGVNPNTTGNTNGAGNTQPNGSVFNNQPGYAGGSINTGSTGGSTIGGAVGNTVGGMLGGSTVGTKVGGYIGNTVDKTVGGYVGSAGGVVSGYPSSNYPSNGGPVASDNSGSGFSLENLARAGQVIGAAVGGKAGTIAVGLGGAVGTYNNCGGITSGEGVTVNCAVNMATTATSIYAATHPDSKNAQTATRVLGVVNATNVIQNVTNMGNGQYIGESDADYAARMRSSGALGSYANVGYGSQNGQPVLRQEPIYKVVDPNAGLYSSGAQGNPSFNQPTVLTDSTQYDPYNMPQFDSQGNQVYNMGAAQPTIAQPVVAKPVVGGNTTRPTPDISISPAKSPKPGSAWDVPQTNAISVSNVDNQALMQQQSDAIVAAQTRAREMAAMYGPTSSQALTAKMAVDGLVKAYTPSNTIKPTGGW